jgi:hypothetical protein
MYPDSYSWRSDFQDSFMQTALSVHSLELEPTHCP